MATCFDSTESSSGLLKNISDVSKFIVHSGIPNAYNMHYSYYNSTVVTTAMRIVSIWDPRMHYKPSVIVNFNSNKLTNQMRQFYKFITWRFVSFNMFRAPPRPSSGAYNCINSPCFYCWSVVVAALLVVVWPRLTTLLPPSPKLKPEAVNAVLSSWWWAWRRPKHVERHKTSSNKLVKLLHPVG